MGKKRTIWKKKLFDDASIRSMIFIYFTITALAASVLISLSLYQRMSRQVTEVVQEESQNLIAQVGRSVESYLRTIMKLSDSLYYGTIKNADLSSQSLGSEFTLLYDNNKDNVENIALFSEDGALLEAVPAVRLKNEVDVTQEEWFRSALNRTENQHFSLPHVQYVFDNAENQYRWVISLSRAVELTHGTSTSQGVLLVDIRYSSLEQLFGGITTGRGGYFYMISGNGEILYHPQMQLLDSGWVQENNGRAAGYSDGNHEEIFAGKKRMATVKTIGYTGWKVVGVTPENAVSLNTIKTRLFIVFVIALIVCILALINSYISSRITNPIRELEKSVGVLEAGNLSAPVYIGGSYEIRHLGKSISDMAGQIRLLMQDIVREHEAKRKQEFDTLQSQINPHFLYNTLEGIRSEAVAGGLNVVADMTEYLAKFFRYTISKVENLVSVTEELENIETYFAIQQFRFGDRLRLEIDDPEPGIQNCQIPKLTMQPLVENAIIHGLERKIGIGVVSVRLTLTEKRLIVRISDNGVGMEPETLHQLQKELCRTAYDYIDSGRGTGIALLNVNNRIRLLFGEQYGITICSTPGLGTDVTVTLPAKHEGRA